MLGLDMKAHPPSRGYRFFVVAPVKPPSWVDPTVQSLGKLLDLPPNWDSYGSPRIESNYINAALQLANQVMREDTPAPSVVPTSRGGIQFEWHMRGIDLEIEFLTPTQVCGLYEDRRTGDSWEADLTFDLKRLVDAIAKLTSRQV